MDLTHGQVRKMNYDWVDTLQTGMERDPPKVLDMIVWKELGVRLTFLPVPRVPACPAHRPVVCKQIVFVECVFMRARSNVPASCFRLHKSAFPAPVTSTATGKYWIISGQHRWFACCGGAEAESEPGTSVRMGELA